MGDRQGRPSAVTLCPFVGVDFKLWPTVADTVVSRVLREPVVSATEPRKNQIIYLRTLRYRSNPVIYYDVLTNDKQQTYFYQLSVGRRRGYKVGVGCVIINDEGISKCFSSGT